MEAVKELQPQRELIQWHANWKVEKYRGDLPTEQDRDGHDPYEVVEGEGNLLLNEGINELFTILCSASSGTKFDNTNARIGVGDSNAAAVATQTDLQSAITYKGMDATYPTYGSSQKATFRATFGSGDGNGDWEEWVVDNAAVAGTETLNRKVSSLGTKVATTTWVFTVEISLS